MPLSQLPWGCGGTVRGRGPSLAVVGLEGRDCDGNRELELLEQGGSPWGFSPFLSLCPWKHLCLCFPPGKRTISQFCPGQRKLTGQCAVLVASELGAFLLLSDLGPCPLRV